jgi:CelD/BcsL family acetyltransferase involved in cellulose biosynthesis
MNVRVYEDLSGFTALQPLWNRLLQSSATNTLFLTPEWQRAWWTAFGQGKALRLLAMYEDGGEPKAIIPLFVQQTLFDPEAPLPEISIERPSSTSNAGSLRSVHLVGGSEVSDYLDIIAPADAHRPAWAAAFDFLDQQKDWQILDLRSLPAASPSVSTVIELARARGWDSQQVREDVCPVLDLPATWDAYLATQLDKKKRHELRRKIRKAEQEVDVRWYLVEPFNLDVGLQVFFQLHRASDPEKDVFMSEPMQGFFRDVAGVARDNGWLRLAILRFDGHAVASYLCFDYRGDRLMYNSGFDVSTYGHLSPGIVLAGRLIEDAIERGLRRFDFLQGDERYKYDLGAQDTEVLRIFIRR